MISILNGTLIEATAGTAVIDVNGIGFELGISATTASSLAQVGSPTRLYTRMVVREDSCTLFGCGAASSGKSSPACSGSQQRTSVRCSTSWSR